MPDIFQFSLHILFILGNKDFTYVTDDVNVIMVFLLLPRVNTLGKWTQWGVMNQFTKFRDESLGPPYTLGIQLSFWWNLSSSHGFEPWGWEELFWGLDHVLFDSFHRLDFFGCKGIDQRLYCNHFGMKLIERLQLFLWDTYGIEI